MPLCLWRWCCGQLRVATAAAARVTASLSLAEQATAIAGRAQPSPTAPPSYIFFCISCSFSLSPHSSTLQFYSLEYKMATTCETGGWTSRRVERTAPLQGVQLKNPEMEIAIECCVRRGALVPGCSKSFNSVLSYPLHIAIIISLPQTS